MRNRVSDTRRRALGEIPSTPPFIRFVEPARSWSHGSRPRGQAVDTLRHLKNDPAFVFDLLRFSMTMFRRDWRAGELRFLFLAVVLAIGAQSGVGFFVDRLHAGLVRDANQMLGADLVMSAEHPLSDHWRETARSRGLDVTGTVEMDSMARIGEGAGSSSRLVSLKAVGAGYPQRGVLRIEAAGGDAPTRTLPAPGSVWIDRDLALRLDAHVGTPVALGDARFVVSRILVDEPARGAALMHFLPRVLMAQADLASTQLLQPGSRAEFQLLVSGEAEAVAALEKDWRAEVAAGRARGVQVDSLASQRAEIGRSVERASRFLALSSLLSSLMAAIAIALATRRFMLRHVDAFALLGCLGMKRRRAIAAFALEFLALGLVAGVAGVALGAATQAGLARALGGFFSGSLPDASPVPGAQAFAAGLALLAGFALPALLRLRAVSQLRLLRGDVAPPGAAAWATGAIGAASFFGLMVVQVHDPLLAAITFGGFAFALLLVAGLAAALVRALGLARGAFHAPAWRLALGALHRQPGATITQVVALTLGLMALLLMTTVRLDLMRAWTQDSPLAAPTPLVIDIQPDQRAAVLARLAPYAPEAADDYRARLVEIDGKPVSAASFKDEDAKSLVDREIGVSAPPALPVGQAIVEGRWYAQPTPGHLQASVDTRIADVLKLRLGEALALEVGGQRVVATITSVRKFDWTSRRLNHMVYIEPAAAAELAHTTVATVHLPDDPRVVDRLTQAFPNLTVVDVAGLMAQMRGIVEQIAGAVQFLFVFALLAGVLVLYVALAGSQDARTRQAALLRALGATRAQLGRAQRIEHLVVGGLAGVLSAAGAFGMSWALARFVFRFDWHVPPLLWLAALAAALGSASIGGWLALRPVLKQPPLASLRGA